MNRTLVLALVASSLASSALADVAFNNFDGNGAFNTGNGYTISGSSSAVGQNYDQGDQFVSATTGDINTITVAMGYVTGTNSCTMRLYADSGDTLGSLMGTWVISGMGNFGSAYSPSIINVAPGVGVAAGQKYWLIADSADDAWLAWNLNNTGGIGGHLWVNNGVPNYSVGATNGAFRVDTTPVPEPVSMIALASGLVALARRRRKV